MKSSTAAKPRKTTAFQRLWLFHWIMSFFYLILFAGGIAMVRIPRELFVRDSLYELHKSVGVITLVLLVWRIILLLQIYVGKYKRKIPNLASGWLRTLALHTALYILMLIMPISGFFLSNSFQSQNVHLFNLTLPDLFPENSEIVELARNMHFWLAYGLLSLIVVHGIERRKFVSNFFARKLKTTNSQSNDTANN